MNTNRFRVPTPKKYQFLISFFFLCLGLHALSAQESYLIADENIQTILAQDERYQDFAVPEIPAGVDQLIIEAEGADGGWVEYTYYDRFNTKRTRRSNGGEGATVSAVYSLGNQHSQISPGDILRLIVGTRGKFSKFDLLTEGNYGAGGGGGTAVLLSKDGGGTWELLLVAGGGGGAGVRFLNLQDDLELNAGQPGCSEENGFGGNHHQLMMADGGLHGQGGHSNGRTGGGGGAYGDGEHNEGQLHYGNAGWKEKKLGEMPMGGLGGSPSQCQNGGWGFGGGGSGDNGGGGGGGYSGGGAGLEGFGGGGGGSYVNQVNIFPSDIGKTQNGNTNNSGDGFVRYKFTKK